MYWNRNCHLQIRVDSNTTISQNLTTKPLLIFPIFLEKQAQKKSPNIHNSHQQLPSTPISRFPIQAVDIKILIKIFSLKQTIKIIGGNKQKLYNNLQYRNQMFSKKTIDLVKLAKQYIQNKYQTLIYQQQKNQSNWNKILYLIQPNHQNLQQLISNLQKQQLIQKRHQRIKDTLANYHLYNLIGRGAFGQVRLARNIHTSISSLTSDQIVAIKRVQKTHIIEKKQIYNIYLQRDLMTKTTCKFIVKIKSAFQDQNYLYFAMEYIQGGDLLHLLIDKDIFTQQQTKFYIGQLVLAVQQLHKINFIHRDIKPDNILIDQSGHIKISDFGLSKYLQHDLKSPISTNKKRFSKLQKLKKLTQIKNKQKSFSKVGTPDYISPQVLISKTYNHSVDLWGIGVIMFQCLFGYPPFTDESSKQVCHKVANWLDYLQFPSDTQISTQAKMLILGLINDTQHRLTIQQIKIHPFFYGFDWQHIFEITPPYIPTCKNQIDTSNFDSFQLKNPWNQNQLNFIYNSQNQLNQPSRTQHQQQLQEILSQRQPFNRATIGPKFKFAGFDYRKLSDDPLQLALSDLQRKSYSHKQLKKLPSKNKTNPIKHQKTQQHYSSIKKLMKPKKLVDKKNQLLYNSTTNNTSTSFNRSKLPSKQFLLKTYHKQQIIQQQNFHSPKFYKDQQQLYQKNNKKFSKNNNISKKQQICHSSNQKNKLKKIISLQSDIKNI